ncbi:MULTISPECIES: hypothetical protein [Bacillus cereus group]|uniref:hypothetical protein n=1 Tax=Bacillus cereus group TaxID=86661 RepID=UPI0006801900|nr:MULTISPECIES: hypothetical protein [Bacillus cereus group]PGQ56083.1 hypothetical protein COA16_24765 [Bacillus thuringiensis]
MENTHQNKNKYEDRAIVFLDFLGFSNIVEKTVNSDTEFQELLETLNNIVNYATTTSEDEARLVLHPQDIEKVEKKYASMPQDYKEKFEGYFEKLPLKEKTTINPSDDRRVTIFSDSVVISYPIDCMYALLINTWSLASAIATSGYLIRGGITFGKLYHDDRIVFGPAMNEAYRLESEVAKMPRIILDSNYIEKAREYSNKDENEYSVNYLACIQTDPDFDNYQFIDFTSATFSANSFPQLENRIINDLNEIASNIPNLSEKDLKKAENIQEKLNWMRKRLNKS